MRIRYPFRRPALGGLTSTNCFEVFCWSCGESPDPDDAIYHHQTASEALKHAASREFEIVSGNLVCSECRESPLESSEDLL